MASKHQVLYIQKSDRESAHECIQLLGGKNSDGSEWEISPRQAIAGIELGEWGFYVDADGNKTDVVVAVTESGEKYLKTILDEEHPENLLSLA